MLYVQIDPQPKPKYSAQGDVILKTVLLTTI